MLFNYYYGLIFSVLYILVKFRIIFYVIVLAGLGIYLGVTRFADPSAFVLDFSNKGSQEIGGRFSLIDQHGKTRHSEEFEGKFRLIYFGYSFCPDVCPMGLDNISKALKILERDRDQIVPIFVTVDPDRDTPKNLNLYSQNFHPRFVMLTGDQKTIEKVKKDFHVFSQKAKESETNTTDYLIDHSTLIYIMDREGKFIRMFPHTTEPEKIAAMINESLSGEYKANSGHP